MKDKKKLIGSVMLMLAALMWGASYSIQNIMAGSLKTFTVIFLKGFGGFLLLLFCLIQKREFSKKAIIYGTLIGVVNGAGLIFQQIGISNTSVSKASFISALYIIFVPVFGLFTAKKPKKKFWLAICLACVGMYFLCVNGALTISYGDLITLVGAACFGLQIVLIDSYIVGCDVLVFCGFQQATVSIISGILMFVIEKPQLSDFNGLLWPILYVMLVSGLIAQIMQNRYQMDVEPTLASLLMSLESVFGALGGWLILNQTLTFREIIGCVIIFIAILIAE